jgi:tetratricopeptide (TPR) repeat protein
VADRTNSLLQTTALALAFGAISLVASTSSALAGDVRVRGAEMNRFGRIALEFDRAIKVTARASNGVLVVSFGEPTTIRQERLPVEMPDYVATVRHDPDRTGLRVALAGTYRVNVLEAGEKTFIDLLPENWTGLPPGLPPDVVAELARRAREAEAKIRAEDLRRRTEPAKALKASVARLPTLTRIVFEPPEIVPVRFDRSGSEVTVLFDAPLTFDRTQLATIVQNLTVEEGDGALVLQFTVDSAREVRSFREDESFVLDIAETASASAPAAPQPPKAEAGKAATEDKAQQAAVPSPGPALPAAAPAQPAPPKPAPPKAAPSAQRVVQPAITASASGMNVRFPFLGRVAAAAFEHAGQLTLVFHTDEPIAPPALPAEAARFARALEVTREGAFAIVRIPLAGPRVARLSPQESEWVLSLGSGHTVPSQPLGMQRSVDEDGRTVVTVPLADSSGVYWLDDPVSGEKIAVVTAYGAPHGVPRIQRFVEFSLLPSLHGLAVAAAADDVIVQSGLDGVTITRGRGLTVSMPLHEPNRIDQANAPVEPVIRRDWWQDAQRGSARERSFGLMRAAAEAPPSLRGATRLELARVLLANRLNHEAAGVLDYASREDPKLAEDRALLILSGIAALGKGHSGEARKYLTAPPVAEDPEGILWRAAVDEKERRWPQALAGFRRAMAVIEGYPDVLQAELRLQVASAALEMRDLPYAEGILSTLLPLAAGTGLREEVMLARARLDEALGRGDVAVDVFRHLAETGKRPVAAEATLAWVDVALRLGTMDPNEAIAKLETLAMIWRRGEVEVATLGRLGRLYAEAGRWREAFVTARRANRMFTDHEITRSLHEDTARLFEDLFLTGKGESLSQVDALALYFDFKEFTPIGRRGDEIVRRLADRLVELDLLEQAASLLQHQVDNRLVGAARATVAARLASIRLMDGKPTLALQALHRTRLPELPASINKARLLLEARALSDLSRTDLALEVVEGESGPEVERLRADILWSGRRWREAGEAHERILGTRWQETEPLSEQNRIDVMRAAIAFSLADDALGLDRLRAKFAAKMADSADAGTFAFLSQPDVGSTRAFRDLARRVTSADTLGDFLAEYRKRFPEAATPDRPRRPSLPEAGNGAQAQVRDGSEAS